MSAQAEMSRLGWLSASLSTQKHKVMKLLSQISDLGGMRADKPILFQKFLNLMDQVATAKDEEVRILSYIDAIEQKHRFRRKEGKLKNPKPDTKDGTLFFVDECERRREKEVDEYFQLKRLKAVGEANDEELTEIELLAYIDEDEYYRRKRAEAAALLANDDNSKENLMASAVATSPKRPNYGWLWLLAFWVFMTSSQSSNRNQDLTVD